MNPRRCPTLVTLKYIVCPFIPWSPTASARRAPPPSNLRISQLPAPTRIPRVSIHPSHQPSLALTDHPNTMSSVGTPKEGKGDKSRISNPRRILVLTPSTQSHATIPPFLHRLTGVPVAEGTGAGTISSTGKQGNTESVKETSNRGDNGMQRNLLLARLRGF